MIRRTIKAIVFLFALGFAAYGFFLVPLGERTMFEHTLRIASTDEAQELGDELGEASEEISDEIRDQLAEDQDAGQDAN